MSDLDKLRSQPKAKQRLIGVHFDFDGAEITYTNGLGACSGHNDMVLAKSVDESESLTEEQQSILDKIGKEFTPLKKEVDNASVNDNQKEEGNNTDMSELLQKQLDEQAKIIAEMTHERDIAKAKSELAPFELEEEVGSELAEAMVTLGGGEAIIKSLLAVKEAKVLLAKQEETELAKSLSKELGDEALAEQEEKVEKSLLEQLEEKIKSQLEGAK